jgi:exopolyphosphatase/guanosine-5'-triphosphate,3'-diphosphate pyrophosphatase
MFEDAAPPYQPQHWRKAYGSSGTMRAIADAIVNNGLGDGKLTLKSLNALKQYCIRCGQLSELELNGIKPERVAMVIGGLAILIGLMLEFNIEVLLPVEAGLRMGVMWDLYLRATKRDRREVSVQKITQLFHIDMSRANRVADMVKSIISNSNRHRYLFALVVLECDVCMKWAWSFLTPVTISTVPT